MKNRFFVLAISLFLFAISAEAQIKVACVGNSITENSALASENKYPAILQTLLGDKYEVRNYGLGGRTLLKKGNRPYWNEDKYTEVLNWNPDIVIIKLGTNDGKPQNWKYRAEFEKDYIEFIDSFKSLPSKPQIFVCYPIPVLEDNFLPLSDTLLTQQMIPMIKDVAKKTKSKIIDLHTPLVGKPDFVYDKVHPNEKGTNVMARIVAKSVCPKRDFPKPAIRPMGIVFVGNSITEGAGLERNPPQVTVHYLDSLGYDVKYKNCGISGYTTENFLPGGNAFKKVVDAAESIGRDVRPLIFSVKLGTNDSAVKGTTGAPVSPEKYEMNMQLIIDSLHAHFPDAKIMLHHPLWYSPNTHNSATYLQEGLDRLQTYRPIINKLGKKNKAFVVVGDKKGFDVFRKNYLKYHQAQKGNSGTFYLHPNNEGAIILGNLWGQVIDKAIR